MRDIGNLIVSEGVKKLETLHTEYATPFRDTSDIPDRVILDEFALQIAKNIIKENYMIITKEQDLFRHQTVYHGRVTIAPANMRGIITEDYHYEVDGNRFSNNEIKEAIRNKWPERFL